MTDVFYATPAKKLRWSRRLSMVPRWTVVPMLKGQNDAEHSYHATQLTRWLLNAHAQRNDVEFKLGCLEHALDHDLEEAATGDNPSPSKPFKTMEGRSQTKIVVKCADILEALMTMEQEKRMGNAYYTEPVIEDLKLRFENVWFYFDTDLERMSASRVIGMCTSACFPAHDAAYFARTGVSRVHPVLEV